MIAGSSVLSSTGTISYSIGQIDYISSGTGISVSQGIQQAYEKLVAVIDSSITITVWPNPVFTNLYIKVLDKNGAGLMCQLYTINGKLLESKKVIENFSSINMMPYAAATYIVLVTHLRKKAVSFKIIKK